MRKLIILFIVMFIVSSVSARTIAKGRWETGVFGPLTYGYSDRIELSTHPIADFLIPNISMKVSHQKDQELLIATQHSYVYPTPLLRTITKEGIGGIIAPDPTMPQIPHMFSIGNKILITRDFNGCSLTEKLGFSFAIVTGELDSRTTIDLPLVFPSLQVYYNGYGLTYGIDIEKSLSNYFAVSTEMELAMLPGVRNSNFLDHRSKLFWNPSERHKIAIGYILTYGNYPFGTQWHLLPYVDYFWVIRTGKES